MHEINIKNLQDEAGRLLKIEMHLIERMKNEHIPFLSYGYKQCDCGPVESFVDIAHKQKAKFDDSEIVLTIIGTCVANESAAINAIVGSNILPTGHVSKAVIPTLIRHTTGRTEPALKIDNIQPINELIKKINQAMTSQKNKGKLNESEYKIDTKALEHIQKNKQFSTFYHGTIDVLWFLECLYNLHLLSRTLNIDFPFSNYDETHDLPIIEVEFSQPPEIQHSNNALSLLTIPSINSGCNHKILKNQITKASSVLVVLNSIILNPAEEEMASGDLDWIVHTIDGQLYFLINETYKTDDDSDNKKNLISHISKHHPKKKIKEENIFIFSEFSCLTTNENHFPPQKVDLSATTNNALTDASPELFQFKSTSNSIIKNSSNTHKYIALKSLSELLSKLKCHARHLSQWLGEIEELKISRENKAPHTKINHNYTFIDLKRKIHDFLCDCEGLLIDIERLIKRTPETIK